MDFSQQAATISALEAATDALLVALRQRPDPDLDAATAALKARQAALRLLVQTDPKDRPPDLNARLRVILERDKEAADHLRADMDAIRERMEGTRQMMNTYGGRTGAVGPVR
jgi:hypothetical protein